MTLAYTHTAKFSARLVDEEMIINVRPIHVFYLVTSFKCIREGTKVQHSRKPIDSIKLKLNKNESFFIQHVYFEDIKEFKSYLLCLESFVYNPFKRQLPCG